MLDTMSTLVVDSLILPTVNVSLDSTNFASYSCKVVLLFSECILMPKIMPA